MISAVPWASAVRAVAVGHHRRISGMVGVGRVFSHGRGFGFVLGQGIEARWSDSWPAMRSGTHWRRGTKDGRAPASAHYLRFAVSETTPSASLRNAPVSSSTRRSTKSRSEGVKWPASIFSYRAIFDLCANRLLSWSSFISWPPVRLCNVLQRNLWSISGLSLGESPKQCADRPYSATRDFAAGWSI